MSFREIFCQEKAIDVLQRAFASGRWAHAYIFAGPEGVGKFRTACEWARLLLCKSPVVEDGFADSCGSCQSCLLFETGSHPDFNYVYKELREFTADGKGKTTPVDMPIDVIREFLIAKVPIKPTLSQRKVFIVSEAEKLNAASQNALLKVLEEPPAYCCIVLLCTRLEKLLPTTKSRSQIIRFGPIDEDRIIESLQQMYLGKDQVRYFARLAEGSLGTACRWAELELAEAELYQTKRELVNSLVDYKFADTLNFAEELLNKSKKIATVWAGLDENTSRTDINRRAAKTIIQIIISALHDAMILNVTPEKELVNFDQKAQINKLATRFETEDLAEKISGCYRMLHWIESSVNERFIFEQLLLSLVDSDRIKV
jgi:DNA polymerase-3 subunit delta'